ncbi:hypothetical protein PFMC_00590 [Plasmodium falciparum CAMP/Malaysia]|uniref:Uncharacterized protein n=1 Tax=Plasmodium falciparum (isolate Camp / Malaysia) TaxID=5835 RepID=A0A024XEA3_PLAFC|nr:hypothetical protein PFMC_00590 [Plasmodium falciparum CAMP/Malaysia]
MRLAKIIFFFFFFLSFCSTFILLKNILNTLFKTYRYQSKLSFSHYKKYKNKGLIL